MNKNEQCVVQRDEHTKFLKEYAFEVKYSAFSLRLWV